jgi:hypothetical protein
MSLLFALLSLSLGAHSVPSEGPAPLDAASDGAPAAEGAGLAAPELAGPPPVRDAIPAPSRPFDSQGNVYLSGATSAALGGGHLAIAGARANSFELGLDASMGYFTGRHLALGGKFAVAVAGQDGATSADFSVGPLLVARARVGQSSAFLPSFGILYTLAYPSGGAPTLNLITLDFAAPFAIPILPHVLVTVGPYIAPGFGSAAAGGATTGAFVLRYGVKAGLLAWR